MLERRTSVCADLAVIVCVGNSTSAKHESAEHNVMGAEVGKVFCKGSIRHGVCNIISRALPQFAVDALVSDLPSRAISAVEPFAMVEDP